MITLGHAAATCELCGHRVHQIDSTRKRATQVVTEAMEKHVADEHPAARGEDDR